MFSEDGCLDRRYTATHVFVGKTRMSTPPEFPPMGMGPNVWGPILWTTMHIVSLGYSDEPTDQQKEAAVGFYRSLEFMIPCPVCQLHYSENMKTMPVENAVNNRSDLIYWVFRMHNKVNEQLGKPQITFEQYIKNMRTLGNRTSINLPPTQTRNTTEKVIYTVGGVCAGAALVCGIVAAYYVYNNHKK